MEHVFGKFPNRPKHKDFWNLSEIVLQQDGKTEDADFDFEAYISEVIDPDTVTYMAMQRAMRVGDTSQVTSHAAIFLDAFMLGIKWQQRKDEAQ